jgi:hypothetical protein
LDAKLEKHEEGSRVPGRSDDNDSDDSVRAGRRNNPEAR